MIKNKIKQLMHRVDALTLRERLLVLAAAIMVIGGCWEAFLAGPLEARERAASLKIEATQERIAQLDAAMAIAAEGIGGGITDQFARVQALRREVEAGAESMRIFTSDLIDPAQMRFVLEDLIRRQGKLALVRASNLPVRPMLEPENPDEAADDREGPLVFRHGLILELEGTYLDCLDYLEAVEQLPWKIHWAGLRVQAEEHPRNRIILELLTLSLDEDWIGV
jgi:MSHA biogenesis protein MshJ